MLNKLVKFFVYSSCILIFFISCSKRKSPSTQSKISKPQLSKQAETFSTDTKAQDFSNQKLSYEIKRLNFQLLTPDINKSDVFFKVIYNQNKKSYFKIVVKF